MRASDSEGSFQRNGRAKVLGAHVGDIWEIWKEIWGNTGRVMGGDMGGCWG